MSYQPLATKYRPERFEDLVGQEAVARALAGAIRLDRLHHSIIFSGVRGIGKTTTARLLAKALNCEAGPTPSPCGKCASCVAITRGNHEDVLEIDGASNNGVDEVRALKETVSYVSQRSKYKIYIIDEVHMLSVSAFNALLKTLEEPPPDVYFIFATTELHKVPATVVGRCLTFHLKKMTVDTIANRLERILTSEGLAFDPRAIHIVAREGNGSMRDALTFLDQIIAVGNGKVTTDCLQGFASHLSSAPVLDLLAAMVLRDGRACIDLIDRLDQFGVVFTSFLDDLARFARHGFVLAGLGSADIERSLFGLTEDEVVRLANLARTAGTCDLNRIFRVLMQCRRELDGSDLDRFVLENNVLEWCCDPGLPDLESMLRGEEPGRLPQSLAPTTPDGHRRPVEATGERPKSLITKDFLAEIKNAVPCPSDKAAELPLVNDGAAAREQTSRDVSSLSVFPASWQDLVCQWKKLKPLQARKLEEVHPLEYSSSVIKVAVDPSGMIGPALLQLSAQKAIEREFRDLFGFAGQFIALPKDQSSSTKVDGTKIPEPAAPVPSIPRNPSAVTTSRSEGATVSKGSAGAEAALPESILEKRSKEKADRRDALLNAARDNQLTQEILSKFSGRISDVRVTDPSLGEFS